MRSISDLENTASATDNQEFDDAPSDVSDNHDEPTMEVDNAPTSSSTFVTFNCSTAGCVKQYRRFSNLIKHHARGDHVFKPDKVTLRDHAILMYKDRAESVKPNQTHELNHFNLVSSARTVTVPVQFSSRELVNRFRFPRTELVDRFQFLELELGSQFFKKRTGGSMTYGFFL